MLDCTFLIDTNLMSLQTFSLVVPYQHAFKKTCPKQLPLKLSSNTIISQLITYISVEIIAFKLVPSFLTNAMIFFSRPKEYKRLLKFIARVCFLILIASNNPIIICLGYQFASKKLTTNAKISWAPLDIHNSKLVVVNKHSAN